MRQAALLCAGLSISGQYRLSIGSQSNDNSHPAPAINPLGRPFATVHRAESEFLGCLPDLLVQYWVSRSSCVLLGKNEFCYAEVSLMMLHQVGYDLHVIRGSWHVFAEMVREKQNRGMILFEAFLLEIIRWKQKLGIFQFVVLNSMRLVQSRLLILSRDSQCKIEGQECAGCFLTRYWRKGRCRRKRRERKWNMAKERKGLCGHFSSRAGHSDKESILHSVFSLANTDVTLPAAMHSNLFHMSTFANE